ncbi:MAG: hypothetical protein IPM46_08210 [Flavobacteriales bacterium]|nr:hypothetical protein [Flavobacteriales bacterium]
MSSRSERTLQFAAAAIVFVYLALRAVLVPSVHDEAATFQTYVLTGRYLPYLSHWDAGNHFLITAVGRASYLLFGPQLFVLRAFPLLCFALYAWYAVRFSHMLADPVARWSCFGALLLTPFLIEFFALFRGYGPSLALLLMAVFHLLRIAENYRRRDLLLVLLAMLLACSASLTLIMLWCLTLAITCAILLRDARNDFRSWLMLLTLGLVPLSLAARYSLELAERGLLYYGTKTGVLLGTLGSLGKWVLGVEPPIIGALLLLIPVVLGVAALRTTTNRHRIAVLLLLMLGELLGRVVLGELFGVLYPVDRTAMHLLPLLILLFTFATDALRTAWPSFHWVSLVLLWLPGRAIATANLDRTAYWPEQAIPPGVFAAVQERQARSERPLLVGGYRQNPRVWIYGSMLRGGELNFIDEAGFPQPTCDLMLLDPSFFTPPVGFHPVLTASTGRLVLLERSRPLRTTVALDSTLTDFIGDSEFLELWSPYIDSVQGREWLIEVGARLQSDHMPLELRIVVEVRDEDDELMLYDVVDIEDMRPAFHGDRLHVLRRLPAFDERPARVACYFWNPRHQRYNGSNARIRIHEVMSDDLSQTR